MDDVFSRLAFLGEEMGLERVEETRPMAGMCSAQGSPCDDPAEGIPVSMVCLPGGKQMPVLKSMVTSACERNCNYCGMRAGRDSRRVTFKPDEMAKAVVHLTQKGIIQGAFISSGIAGGGARTQDKLIDTAEILRKKLGYQGYLHLKIMPGAEFDQVYRAMQLADRVSVNLEGPNTKRLQALAPQKVFLEELVRPLKWVEQIRTTRPGWQGWKGRWPSTTTQFVVGAVGESDLELLSTVESLNRQVRLARGYFSAFRPTRGTPFEELPSCNPWREHRLYQASFLLRDYGFGVEEMPFQGGGDLPLEEDPKLAWARQNLKGAPIEVNRVDREQLLRIPGIGPKGAAAILQARRGGRLHSLEDLKRLGIAAGRAAPFILLDGARPAFQLGLFA
jgi:predicted DNA-binding helix-hairpin-helix protein